MKMEYSVFKVEEKKDSRRNLFGTAARAAGQVYINLGIVSLNVFIFSFQQ
jgi:hypothetical protein